MIAPGTRVACARTRSWPAFVQTLNPQLQTQTPQDIENFTAYNAALPAVLSSKY